MKTPARASTATKTKTKTPAKKQASASKAPVAKQKAARTTAAKAQSNPAGNKVAGMSSEAVRAKTGKGWDEWFAILDRARAATWTHKEIARWLHDEQGVPPWWCQMVTVGFEQARGLRAMHETATGFTASASKTVAVPIAALWSAWDVEKKRARWLGKQHFTVRKATPEKSIRITWGDGSNVEVMFYAKGEGKSLVTVQHMKLEDADEVVARKQLWSRALERLKSDLESAR